MKRAAVILGVAVISAGVVGLALRAGRRAPAHPAVTEPASGVLDIDEFMRRPEAHPGQVRVQGIVSTVQAGDRLVTLIDRREFAACGVVTCAPLTLPVRWAGAMPQIEEGVEVTGRIRTEAGKLVFVADAMSPASTDRVGPP